MCTAYLQGVCRQISCTSTFEYTYMLLAQTLTLISRLLHDPRIPKKPVTLPRRLREGDTRERMKAALNLLQLREARVSHDVFSADAQKKYGLMTSNNEVNATDESLDSASVEELAAMEEATRKQYDRIVSELKKRDERKQRQDDAGDAASNVAEASGPTATRTPRRSGRLTSSTSGESQPGAGAAKKDNSDTNGADIRSKPTVTNDKTAKYDDDSSVTQVVSNIVDAAVTSVAGKDATSTIDTITSMAANVEQKIDQDHTAQVAIDSALTPVSEANKENDDQTSAVTNIKPAMSGVETPETEPNVTDQATSPADAMELD